MHIDLILISFIIVLVFPLGVVFFLKWGLKGLVLLLGCPYYLCAWCLRYWKARRRRINYEILGTYIAVLGNNPSAVAYFKKLIEDGIAPRKLRHMLEMNLLHLKKLEYDQRVAEILEEIQQNSEIQEITAQQQQILARSKANLEKIRFQEKALEGLYHKIQKKYGV